MVRHVTYAIGDIHGRLDLAQAAVSAIERHAGDDHARMVFLGDYVDRGPDSRGVVDLMIRLQETRGAVCLKGNHESLMLRALARPQSQHMNHWLRLGGQETLSSYGVSNPLDAEGLVPRAHTSWMTKLPLTSGDGRRIYVHAGLNPGVPFEKQDEEDCMWIRERFLTSAPGAFDRHIVHGHTPEWREKPEAAQPELLAHRTNLDTGAYATGVLTVGVFPEDFPGGPAELIVVRERPDHEPTVEIAPASSAPEPAAAPRQRNWKTALFRR